MASVVCAVLHSVRTPAENNVSYACGAVRLRTMYGWVSVCEKSNFFMRKRPEEWVQLNDQIAVRAHVWPAAHLWGGKAVARLGACASDTHT